MRYSLLVIALIACAPLMAQAANDLWEPNNTPQAAAPMWNHISPAGRMGGYGFALNGRPIANQLVIISNDTDWYRIGGIVAVPTGTMNVYLNQTGELSHLLSLEVTDTTGQTILAGPSTGSPSYIVQAAPQALYDGARASIPVTNGTEYLIRVWAPTPPPSNIAVPYEISVEFSNADSAEGNYSNNFPGSSPNPDFTSGNPADATPTGFGAGNAKTYTNMSWRGWDYYMVKLSSPASITVDLGNFTNLPTAATNFDLYWVRRDGIVLPPGPPGTAVAGATDTFPNGWPGMSPIDSALTTPNTSEQLTTPPLSPGVYYFQVVAWDISPSPGVILFNYAGNYDISVTLTAASDDALEGPTASQNDTAQNATTLPLGETANLRLLFNPEGIEEDWYKINVADGGNISVRLTLDGPTTDHMEIRLYKPNAANPGQAADLVDSSLLNNTGLAAGFAKTSVTASEIVGTWGSVGNSGNTGLPSGDYLVRVTRGNNFSIGGVLQTQTYRLNATVSQAVDVAPDDSREPNNTFAQATNAANTYLELPRGLTTNLKAMDGVDIYRVPGVPQGQSAEISLIYDASSTIELDVAVLDLNMGPNFATTGVATILVGNVGNETTASSIVTVTGTAGASWAPPPSTGALFIMVQRWNSVGTVYSINVNINGADPLPPLRINSVNVTPSSVAAPNNAQVTIAVENLSGNAVDLATLALSFTHSTGADVGGEYSLSGPTPTLPASIAANSTQNFTFTATSSTTGTNGAVSVGASGTDGSGNQLLGTPKGNFTLTGAQAAVPDLVYQSVSASGLLNPGGSLTVNIVVRNDGTAGGTFGNTPPIDFAFDQNGSSVTGMFFGPSTPSQTLPFTLGIGESRSINWNFTISDNAPLGSTRVVVSGGGPDNPSTQGTANFSISIRKNTATSGGSGGCAIGGPALPWLLVLGAGALAALRRRRAS